MNLSRVFKCFQWLAALLVLLESDVVAAESNTASVTIGIKGEGTANLGGYSGGEKVPFNLGTEYLAELEANAPMGSESPKTIVMSIATCGTDVMVKSLTKTITSYYDSSTPPRKINEDVVETESDWRNFGASTALEHTSYGTGGAGTGDSGDDSGTGDTDLKSVEIKVKYKIRFQRQSDIASRSSSGGGGSGGDGQPGKIIGKPGLLEKAYVMPAEPRPLVGGSSCCGGSLSTFAGVTIVPQADVENSSPPVAYEFPLGGSIEPGSERGVGYGDIVFKGDIYADVFVPAVNMTNSVIETPSGAEVYFVDSTTTLVLVMPFGFVIQAAADQESMTVKRFAYQHVVSSWQAYLAGAPFELPSTVQKRYEVSRIVNGPSRRVDFRHYDGTSQSPSLTNQYIAIGTSAQGVISHWLLNDDRERVSLTKLLSGNQILQEREHVVKKSSAAGDIWLVTDYSQTKHQIIGTYSYTPLQKKVRLMEKTVGMGASRIRTVYTYGDATPHGYNFREEIYDIKTYSMDDLGQEYLSGSDRPYKGTYNNYYGGLEGPYSPWLNDTGDDPGDWKLWHTRNSAVLVNENLAPNSAFQEEGGNVPAVCLWTSTDASGNTDMLGSREVLSMYNVLGRKTEGENLTKEDWSTARTTVTDYWMDAPSLAGRTRGGVKRTYLRSGMVTDYSVESVYQPSDETSYPTDKGPYKQNSVITDQKLDLNTSPGRKVFSTAEGNTTEGEISKESWKTTKTTTVTGVDGVVMKLDFVWTGDDWLQFSSQKYTYDSGGRLASVLRDGQQVEHHSYPMEDTEVVTDENGVATMIVRNEDGEIEEEKRLSRPGHSDGWQAQSEIVTTYEVSYESDDPPMMADGARVSRIVQTERRTAGGMEELLVQRMDAGGGLKSQTDASGITTTFGREYAGGYLVETRTVGDKTYSTSSYLDGKVRAVGGSGQVQKTYTYTLKLSQPQGILETETGGDGVNYRLRTGDGELIEETINGVKTKYQYDTSGRVIGRTVTNGAGERRYIWEYDYRDVVIKEGWDMNNDGQLTIDSEDTLTERDKYFWRDNDGRVWLVNEESVYTKSGPGAEKLTTLTREAQGMGAGSETWITGSNGVEERVIKTVVGGVMTITSTTSALPGLSQVMTHYYGRLVAFLPYGATSPTLYRHDAFGRQTEVIDPRTSLSEATTYYPNNGKIYSTVNAAGESTHYHYRATDGSIEWVKPPGGGRTDYAWNNQGKLVPVSGDGVYPVTYNYHPTTYRLQSFTLPGYEERSFSYDGQRRLTGRTYGSLAGEVGYSYWPDGSLKQRRWGPASGGVTTTYTYDFAGRVTGFDYGDSTSDIAMSYDRVGRLDRLVDDAGIHAFNHGNDGDLIESVSGGVWDGLTLHKRVNGAGSVIGYDWSFAGVSGGASYEFANGKLSQAALKGANENDSLVNASYVYHSNSSMVSQVSRPISGGHPLVGTWVLDAVGRPDVITWQRGGIVLEHVDYGLDSAGRRVTEGRIDGTMFHYDYNDRGELVSVDRRRADGSLRPDWSHAYDYDASGERVSTRTPEGENIYRYSLHLRPTFVTYPESRQWIRGRAHPLALVAINGIEAEREGHIWRKQVNYEPGHAKMLEVTASRPDMPVQAPITRQRRLSPSMGVGGVEYFPHLTDTTEISHDTNGNLVFDGRWIYQWDGERRPVVMEERFLGVPGESQMPVRRLEMKYDAKGRRISKKLLTNVRTADGLLVNSNWTFERETIFLWQDWVLLAEFVRYSEMSTPLLRRSYLWGLDVSGTLEGAGGVGGLLWVAEYVPGRTASHRQLAPCYDGNGNILKWVENEGAEVLPAYNVEYDPFGRVLVDEPTRVERNKRQQDLNVPSEFLERPPFGFSTKFEDRETGLLYYGFRYYSPELGRWLNRDPIEEQGGVNLYGMVGNDPVNKFDPDGRAPMGWPVTPPPGYPPSMPPHGYGTSDPFTEGFLSWFVGNGRGVVTWLSLSGALGQEKQQDYEFRTWVIKEVANLVQKELRTNPKAREMCGAELKIWAKGHKGQIAGRLTAGVTVSLVIKRYTGRSEPGIVLSSNAVIGDVYAQAGKVTNQLTQNGITPQEAKRKFETQLKDGDAAIRAYLDFLKSAIGGK